ncbi:sulfatase [Advenella faeciporci]|uniref:Sulfatase n=1 Tax=Advenella faeciporci TaxID=797535 RepID=A0A918MXA9_9BURK|nr:sulfatase-like hydrolase/transferase [Advenella faeciporci]GGW80945.1 sulfatase [Advenella faeciporci]
MTKPVNFLIFIADQLRADHLGCYGNQVVKTPVIDALARRGFHFTNMHVATPICMPNRASMMTGRYPSVHGARHNGIPLSLKAKTFVDSLRLAGYNTAQVGKIHLQNMTSMEPLWPLEPEERTRLEAFEPDDGNYNQEKRDRWLESNDYDLDYPYYGFEKVKLVDDHADIVHGHYRYWLRQNIPNGESLIGPENAIPTPDYQLSKVGQAWRTRLTVDQYPSAYIANRSMDLLEDYAQSKQPFFLQVSFPDPHHPFTPPGEYWDMYKPEDMTLPDSFYSEHERLEHVKWLHEKRDSGTAAKKGTAAFACDEREAKEALALNYGSISNIDAQIGRVLDKLEETGLADNIVVIFTSDHGDFLGDHQLLLKGPLHYRGLTRVPFIWADPVNPELKTGDSSNALTSTIDLAPTILNRAGVPLFNGIQGKDMAPVVIGQIDKLRDALLIEEEGQRVILGLNTRIRCRSLLTQQYRMTIYDTASWGELYDLEKDPNELNNLWNNKDMAGIRAMMMEKLAYTNLELVDKSPYPTALA